VRVSLHKPQAQNAAHRQALPRSLQPPALPAVSLIARLRPCSQLQRDRVPRLSRCMPSAPNCHPSVALTRTPPGHGQIESCLRLCIILSITELPITTGTLIGLDKSKCASARLGWDVLCRRDHPITSCQHDVMQPSKVVDCIHCSQLGPCGDVANDCGALSSLLVARPCSPRHLSLTKHPEHSPQRAHADNFVRPPLSGLSIRPPTPIPRVPPRR
jgi:hypothetical protein